MFIANKLFGNGSVPSIGGTTSLAAALAGVERAEQALAAARALARAAAKREGRSGRGLFEDSQFILRATGEKWTDQARREGENAMAAIFCRNLDTESADENSPFHHLAKRLKKIRAEDWPEHVAKMRAFMDSAEPRWERMRAAGYDAAIEAEDFEKAAAIYREANPELFGKGAAIVRAAARARMSTDATAPEPEKGSFAARVAAAGRKARGEAE
jgi:hypothetical protein